MNKLFTSLVAFALATVATLFQGYRKAVAVLAAAALSLSAPALAQLHEVETVLGTVSFSETGGVSIPVDATISSGLGVWFAYFAIGCVVAFVMYITRFRRK